jgi:hypothetical protein
MVSVSFMKSRTNTPCFCVVRSAKPGQGLHRFDARQRLADIHGVQQGLVIAGLKRVAHTRKRRDAPGSSAI